MKTSIKNLAILPALITGLNLIPGGRVTAQTFTVLHRFAGYPNDAALPAAGLLLSSNRLYGATSSGGSSTNGTVFAVNTDGTGFSNLHSFSESHGSSGSFGTNNDGYYPQAGLILSGNTLYGTASEGGPLGFGTVFAINTDGTGFTNLHSFAATSETFGRGTNSDGAMPLAGLIVSGNTLYGTASGGGTAGNGTVFAVNTDGTGFTNLHNFTAGNQNLPGVYTNSDGAFPQAGLILSGSTLYGTASEGGTSGIGTVFAVNTDGTGFSNLHSFSESHGSSGSSGTNNDGNYPQAGLILSGHTLYGTANEGGTSGLGTVFAINTDGTGFTNLHSFAATSETFGHGTNSEGANPSAGLILSGNTLFGIAEQGGSWGAGTVFAIKTNGTGFTNVHSFGYDGGGTTPLAGLVLSGSTMYGTTSDWFSTLGVGTVFSLSFRPQLSIVPSVTNVILSWPTNVAGFDYTGYALQSTTNLVFPGVWASNSPAPTVVNGQNTVANAITGTRRFYRLSQ